MHSFINILVTFITVLNYSKGQNFGSKKYYTDDLIKMELQVSDLSVRTMAIDVAKSYVEVQGLRYKNRISI